MAQHIVTPKTYVLVFVALLALTALTVGTSRIEALGAWHTPLGLFFAVCKALLVILFFMHVLYSSRLTWVVALSGLLWLAILLGMTLTDYVTRSSLPLPGN